MTKKFITTLGAISQKYKRLNLGEFFLHCIRSIKNGKKCITTLGGISQKY